MRNPFKKNWSKRGNLIRYIGKWGSVIHKEDYHKLEVSPFWHKIQIIKLNLDEFSGSNRMWAWIDSWIQKIKWKGSNTMSSRKNIRTSKFKTLLNRFLIIGVLQVVYMSLLSKHFLRETSLRQNHNTMRKSLLNPR